MEQCKYDYKTNLVGESAIQLTGIYRCECLVFLNDRWANENNHLLIKINLFNYFHIDKSYYINLVWLINMKIIYSNKGNLVIKLF